MPRDSFTVEREPTPLLDALDEAVKDAADRLTTQDLPLVHAARACALKIDMQHLYFEDLTREAKKYNRTPPSMDNASHSQFLKYLEALGFTPVSRDKLLADGKPKKSTTAGGAGLRGLRAVPKPAG